jgi:hypothetical protein
MNLQKSLQSSRFERGSIKIAYCPDKNKKVPIANMDLTEEELHSILSSCMSLDTKIIQRLQEAGKKMSMVKETIN